MINKDYTKTDQDIKSAIKNLLLNNKYKNNFQFYHFVLKILGIDGINSNKLFDEFFSEEFKNYYNYLIKQIKNGNYYYLNVLNNFLEYYENKKVSDEYSKFVGLNTLNYLKYQNKITKINNMKYALLTRYFQTIYDLKVQKQILNDKIEIKNGLIKTAENQILIKNILFSESLYQKELLKLMDRSIAENIIVYLIDKFPNSFKKITLNLKIYNDVKNYYKNNNEKLVEFENKNKDKIKTIVKDIENGNSINTSINNNITFEKAIELGTTIRIEAKELNQMLEFLFYIKEQGNSTAHPKESKPSITNPNKHIFEIPKNNDNINQVKEYAQNLLKNEFMKKYFVTKVKPKEIFDCLFKSNFKPLIGIEQNEEMNNKIDIILNEILDGLNEVSKDDIIFKNINEKINELKEMRNELKETKLEKDSILMLTLFKEFIRRMDKTLENEKNCLPFLYMLNQNEYESSVTGENYVFFCLCLDYIIKKIILKVDGKIDEYQSFQNDLENIIHLKDQIIYFLNNLYKKAKSIYEFSEPIIDIEKLNDYMNNKMNNSEAETLDLTNIRRILEKLVTQPINWTANKNCNLSTLLFLKQSNN